MGMCVRPRVDCCCCCALRVVVTTCVRPRVDEVGDDGRRLADRRLAVIARATSTMRYGQV